MNLSRFKKDPDSGFFWQQRAQYGVRKDVPLIDRLEIVDIITTAFESRCCTTPPIFDDVGELLNTSDWKENDFFEYSNGRYKVSDVYDDTLRSIISNDCVNEQLKSQTLDIGAIPYEWDNLKKLMMRWKISGKPFPPESWEGIGKKVNVLNFKNIFGLVDFFLSLTLTSTDAERGVSGMKDIKTKKRATLDNKLLSIQLQMKVDGPPIAEFNPQRSIDYFLTHCSSRSKSGKMRVKRINLMSKRT